MSKTSPMDPAGHIKLAVSDLPKSSAFYRELFSTLGYKQVCDEADSAGWIDSRGFGVWLEPAEIQNHPYTFSSPGLHHLCFKAASPKQVDELYAFLKQKGTLIYDPPQAYPEYTKDYYAVFFGDPDGIKLEVAFY